MKRLFHGVYTMVTYIVFNLKLNLKREKQPSVVKNMCHIIVQNPL